jgi:hypothetical protein
MNLPGGRDAVKPNFWLANLSGNGHAQPGMTGLAHQGHQPNVNAKACTPGSRNSISKVRSSTEPFCRMS